jgi:methionyl-tRNA formyltransferase
MRIIFMGTPEFSVPALRQIAKHHEVVAVYTQPDKPVGRGLELTPSPVKKAAQELRLPIHQPERLSLPGEYEKLAHYRPDMIVVVAYGQLLKQNVLDLPRLGCINIHSSLLPRWRGAAPIHHAILSGDAETGVCTMKMVLKLDAGAIYDTARTMIDPNETLLQLHDRLSLLGGELILKTLHKMEQGTVQAQEQDDSLVTYAHKLTKEMEILKPSVMSATQIHNQVRALNPWPGTSLWFKNEKGTPERLKIKKSTLLTQINLTPNQLHLHAGMLILGTPKGALQLLIVQQDGKKEGDSSLFIQAAQSRKLTFPLSLVLP